MKEQPDAKKTNEIKFFYLINEYNYTKFIYSL